MIIWIECIELIIRITVNSHSHCMQTECEILNRSCLTRVSARSIYYLYMDVLHILYVCICQIMLSRSTGHGLQMYSKGHFLKLSRTIMTYKVLEAFYQKKMENFYQGIVYVWSYVHSLYWLMENHRWIYKSMNTRTDSTNVDFVVLLIKAVFAKSALIIIVTTQTVEAPQWDKVKRETINIHT